MRTTLRPAIENCQLIQLTERVFEEIFPARTSAESIDLLDGVCLGACGGSQRQYLAMPNNS
jgi:hypothetical protein